MGTRETGVPMLLRHDVIPRLPLRSMTIRSEVALPVTQINYGSLYNWYAATYNMGSASIAPAGWHVPTSAELETLMTTLDPYGSIGENVAGGSMKETGLDNWLTPNTGATNSSGLTVRGSGMRTEIGTFGMIKESAYFHSSDNYFADLMVGQGLYLSAYSEVAVDWSPGGSANIGKTGMSLRLIKNNSIDPGSLTDIDGNVYPSVKIGDQVWMAENLAVSRYNDGTVIPNVTNNTEWANLTTGAMCYYNNNIDNSYTQVPLSDNTQYLVDITRNGVIFSKGISVLQNQPITLRKMPYGIYTITQHMVQGSLNVAITPNNFVISADNPQQDVILTNAPPAVVSITADNTSITADNVIITADTE